MQRWEILYFEKMCEDVPNIEIVCILWGLVVHHTQVTLNSHNTIV